MSDARAGSSRVGIAVAGTEAGSGAEAKTVAGTETETEVRTETDPARRARAAGPRRRSRGALDSGYTLLELAAVIAIVLIAGVAVVAGVSSVRKASLTTSAARVAASVRYLYDLAVLNNRPYRMVIDLDSRSYWAEPAAGADGCGAALLPSEEERRFGVAAAQPAVAESPVTGGATEAPAQSPEPALADEEGPSKPRRSPKENLLTRFTLPEGISFAAVMTSHQDEPAEAGEAFIFFFPSGYAEKAMIQLKKGDDIYTVETVPLRGIGRIYPEALDLRRVAEGG